MNTEKTITKSLDYLIEINDDDQGPNQPEPEVVTIPPMSYGMESDSAPPATPEQGPPR